MDAKEFLEHQYGIILTEEKALIHPQMLIKAMEEYAATKNTSDGKVCHEGRITGQEKCKIRCSDCDWYY